MLERNIENFIGCDSSYADANIVLFGAPFDSTTSYRPGHASAHLPCVTKATDWKPTARIRTRISLISIFLTAVIWSFASARVKVHLRI